MSLLRIIALSSFAIVITGCGGPETPPSSPPPPSTATPPADEPDDPPAASPRQALAASLAAKGYTVDTTNAAETVVCSGEDACICLVDLDCTDTDCITFDKNVDIFKRALAAKGDVQVSCELADTGTMCTGSYFRFEGDIYRFEERYFGATGHLIGQRNVTDYPEYCSGRSMVQYAGTVPDCAQPATNVQILCSDKQHERPLNNPMERLLWNLTR